MKRLWWIYWIVLVFLVMEGGPIIADRIRLAITEPKRSDIVIAKENTFVNRPNVNGVNGLGMRCDFAPIVFMGDSVTYGVKVNQDDIFTSILQRQTSQNVLNLGVPGYDMPDVLRIANKWRGAKLVYCYCLNDFSMIPRGYDKDKGLYRKFPRLSHQVWRFFGGTEKYLHRLMDSAPDMTIIVMPFQGPWKGYHVRSLEFIRQYNPLEPSGFKPDDFLDSLHLSVLGHRKMATYLKKEIIDEHIPRT